MDKSETRKRVALYDAWIADWRAERDSLLRRAEELQRDIDDLLEHRGHVELLNVTRRRNGQRATQQTVEERKSPQAKERKKAASPNPERA